MRGGSEIFFVVHEEVFDEDGRAVGVAEDEVGFAEGGAVGVDAADAFF